MRYIFFLFAIFLFIACSSTPKTNTLRYLPMNGEDLGIGSTPTPPPNEPIPNEETRKLLMNMKRTKIPIMSPDNNANNAPAIGRNVSNSLSIMSSSGGLLTLWALNPGNWVWGYTPLDAQSFNKAPFWRIISFSNGQVMIQNEEKSTCLQAYRNGAVHEICDSNNPGQLWILNFFDNQAVQIQNVDAKMCLQTPTNRATTYYSIYLTKCAINEPNLDQQWYITPIIDIAAPVFVTNPN